FFYFIYILTISFFFFSSRRRHTRFSRDWSSDVCSSDLILRILFPTPLPASRSLVGDLTAALQMTTIRESCQFYPAAEKEASTPRRYSCRARHRPPAASRSPPRRCVTVFFGVEAGFPGIVVALAGPHLVGQRRGGQHQAVQPALGRPAGTLEVDEQHGAQAVGVIVDLVRVEIVEHHGPAFFPYITRAADLDPAAFARFGHHQPQVQAQHPVVWATVQRDPLAGLEDRKERRPQPRYAGQRVGGGRATGQVALRTQPVGQEQEGFPLVVAGDHGHVGRDFVERRQALALPQQRLQFGADGRRPGFQPGYPAELGIVENGPVSYQGGPGNTVLQPIEEPEEGPREETARDGGTLVRCWHGRTAKSVRMMCRRT